MGRRSKRRGLQSRGVAYIGAAGLAVVALISALILFLRRRARDTVPEPVEYPVQEIPETPESVVEEVYTVTYQAEAQKAPEEPADQAQVPVEDQREAVDEAAVDEGAAEKRKRTVREFVRRLDERPAVREEDDSGETGEESVGVVGDPTPTSGEFSQDTQQETEHSDEMEAAGGQAAVVGVLAKMGEAYQEVGGTQFILSSEDDGNFDLLGKEDELDAVYQQQVSARVVGKIIEDDSPTRKLEVEEVEPA